tara:strand:+ start:37 stop:327 length:291 start_codon:yes stop_codon:yes gene_type:complete
MSTSTAKFLREVSKSDDFQVNTLVANKYYTVKHHIVDYWDGEFDTSIQTVVANLQNALQLDEEGRFDQMVQSIRLDDARDILDAVYFLVHVVDFKL